MIEVYQPGTNVTLQGLLATILSVEIGMNLAVTYECVWWNDNTRVVEYVEACEVIATSQTVKTRIGFTQ